MSGGSDHQIQFSLFFKRFSLAVVKHLDLRTQQVPGVHVNDFRYFPCVQEHVLIEGIEGKTFQRSLDYVITPSRPTPKTTYKKLE